MTIHHDACPLCGLKLESWAVQDFHFRADHLRDDQPCERCGEWDDARTSFGPFGWMHDGCESQSAYEQAVAHYERWLEGRESA